MFKQCFIITTALLLCNGQLVDSFLPHLSKATRAILDGLTKTSLVTLASQSGALLADGVRALVFLPEAVTRAYGVGKPLPNLLGDNTNNVVLDEHVTDYYAGLRNEDVTLSFSELARKNGYVVEQYEVTTQDGYILSVFRIPGNGSTVFLMHGLLGSADDYIVAGADSGLAYLLANDDHDVWIGNARGTKHSRKHMYLEPTNAKFWNFSWHEIGVFDLPAMIDFTLDVSQTDKVKYIGHSQGTTAFFVMASERPDYNSKVSLMIALSPVAFMSHVRSPVVRLLTPGLPLIYGFTKFVGLYEFLPDNNLLRLLKSLACTGDVLSDIICSNVMFLVAGVGYAQLNFTNLPVLMGHTPAGASCKQLVHYGQGVVSGEFRQFDYGSADNLKMYGKAVPPMYKLEKITAPVALFYSGDDWLAHPSDVEKLSSRLNSVIDFYKIPFEQFNHLDFLWAKDFEALVYSRIHQLFTDF